MLKNITKPKAQVKPHIVIVGAGISGLSAGWFLQQKYGDQIALTILEKENRLGGWIHSVCTSGFLFEKGARSCRTKGAGQATLRLIESLNLQDALIPAAKEASRRFLYVNQSLQPIPTSLFSFLLSPLTRDFLPLWVNEWKIPANGHDETVFQFFARRMSAEFAERLIDPLVAGIYAGDMRSLSMQACFPEIYQLVQQYGSISKGMLKKWWNKEVRATELAPKVNVSAPIFTFKDGLETLVTALGKRLRPHLHTNAEVSTLEFRSENILIKTSNNLQLKADYLFLALPAHSAAKLFCSSNPSLSKQMHSFQAASVAIVNLAWKKKVLSRKGFGYLIPFREQEPILGAVWDSSAFPQQNLSQEETRLSVMLGGALHPQIRQLSERELIKKAVNAIFKHVEIQDFPTLSEASLAKEAIPQYALGHVEKVKAIENELDSFSRSRVRLLGNAWHGISINQCISKVESSIDEIKLFNGNL